MKKIFVLSVAALILGCATSSEPEPVPKIYLSPTNTNVSVGSEVEVNIIVEENQKSFFGISMQIVDNNGLLEFQNSGGFTTGSMFSQNAISFAQDDGSVVHVSVSQVSGQTSTNGSGTVGTLKFQTNSVGNTVIAIDQNELFFYDFQGNEINIAELKIESAAISVQ